MAELIFLGTANAIPDSTHENTHMVLRGAKNAILIDCASNQLVRLQKAGIDYSTITDIILTHFHPDHVSGLPLFLMDMWLLGYQQRLTIHGLQHTLDRAKQMMELFGWDNWPGFFTVVFHQLAPIEMASVLQDSEKTIFSAPVQHMIPTIGLRIEFPQNKITLAYSCDTEPCEQVVRLAKDAKILIHEATGQLVGHSSATQAGEIASRAEVDKLYLIHYPTNQISKDDLILQARTSFAGDVILAEDFLEITIC